MVDRDGRVWRDASLAGMSTPPRPSSTPEVRPAAPDSASSIPDHSPGSASGLAAHVQSLGWESREFSDVRVTAFGKEYPLHRLVLSRSPYFRALMRGPWADASSPSLTLAFDDPFVTAPAVECCLAFLYDKPPAFARCGEPAQEKGQRNSDEPADSFDPLFALRVLAASNFLDLDHLSCLCAEHVAESVSLGDCLALQAALDAREYGEHGERARAAVWGFICAHASLELSHDLHRLHPATLDALMRSDHLWVADECERFALARRVANDARAALTLQTKKSYCGAAAERKAPKERRPLSPLTDDTTTDETTATRVARLVLDDLVSGISATVCETAASERDDDDDDDDDCFRRALDFHALATAATLRDGVRYQHVPFDDLRVMKRLLEAEEKDVRAAAYRRMARGEDDGRNRFGKETRAEEGRKSRRRGVGSGLDAEKSHIFSLEATRALLDSTPARAVAEGWWTRTALAARVARSGAKADWARGVDAPFRFGARFENVRELRDGQGAKHSREVFYAGSLWKLSVQAFSDEDPKGHRTLGLFLHRRPASSAESDADLKEESPETRVSASASASAARRPGDALDALTRSRFSRNDRDSPKAKASSVSHGVSHFADRREVVDVRYELVCPSRHETVRLGSLDAAAKPTTLPRAPKGWGWRTALLHEDLERMCDAQGALRVVAAIVVDAAAEDAGEYDAQVLDAAAAEAAAARGGDDDDAEGFDGDVEENGREHLVLRY